MGYNNGIIILIDPFTSKILLYYNYSYEQKDIQIKKTAVRFLLKVPGTDDMQFIAVFSDSVMMQFNILTKKYNDELIEHIQGLEDIFSFKYKSSGELKQETTFQSVYYQYKPHNLSVVFAKGYKSQEQRNPLAYFKFNAQCITDVKLIAYKNDQDSFVTKALRKAKSKNQKLKDETNLLIFTAYDGFLRIYNYETMKPILVIKADFGGFNCISISRDQKLLAAGGQDDSITLINLANFCTFKLELHKSFVSQCQFFNPQKHIQMRLDNLEFRKNEFERARKGKQKKKDKVKKAKKDQKNKPQTKMEEEKTEDEIKQNGDQIEKMEEEKQMQVNETLETPESPEENKYYLLAGSYDATLSFWEFDIEQFPKNCNSKHAEVPYNLVSQNKNDKETTKKFYFIHDIQVFDYKPICQPKMSNEGIGQIIVFREHMLVCTMNGQVQIWYFDQGQKYLDYEKAYVEMEKEKAERRRQQEIQEEEERKQLEIEQEEERKQQEMEQEEEREEEERNQEEIEQEEQPKQEEMEQENKETENQQFEGKNEKEKRKINKKKEHKNLDKDQLIKYEDEKQNKSKKYQKHKKSQKQEKTVSSKRKQKDTSKMQNRNKSNSNQEK